jgi:hypothetical protein
VTSFELTVATAAKGSQPNVSFRTRSLSFPAKEVAAAETRHRRIVDELEQARQDLVDARATQVWVLLYPHQNLMSSPDTRAVAGGRRTAMERHFPGVQTTLLARNLFACLREDDAAFCAQVSTVDQAAAINGVSAGRLTGREALWSDSDEGRAEAQRERETARRLAEQGHDPEKLAADIKGL